MTADAVAIDDPFTPELSDGLYRDRITHVLIKIENSLFTYHMACIPS